MNNNHSYNLGRFDLDVETPRTTRYNRRRRLERNGFSSDSSAENQRWRDNYAQVADIFNEINNYTSDSDGSQSLPGSPASVRNESESSFSPPGQVLSTSPESTDHDEESSLSPPRQGQVISTSPESTDNDERYPRNVREQLLHEQDDDYASDEDILEYQPIFDDQLINGNAAQNRLEDVLNADDANEIIDARVNVTKAEILLAVLKFSLVYNLPQSAIADLFKMLNIFFNTSVLPQSRYLVDQIFNSESNIDYHALCPNCKNYVRQFYRGREQDHDARCGDCNLQFSLTDPTYRDFFCIMNPEEEIAGYIQNHWNYYQSVVDARSVDSEDINEFHSGLLYRQLRNSLPDDRKNNFITAIFNSDGSPVFESSAFSIWPIQIIINELPFEVRTSKPIVCGLWFGRKKPAMNMFLEPFVIQMNIFSDVGITCNVRDRLHTIYVYAICSCVDSVARAPMQGLTQFNGYFGCNWCLHPGYYIAVGRGGSVKYILMDEPVPERNEIDTLRDAQQAIASGQPINGVINESYLTRLNYFNIVSGFVPDPMHYLDLGIGKQFIKYWFDIKNMPYSLTNAEIDHIDNILKQITVPSKLMRNSRSIRDRTCWKAKEFQNWILYYSTIVLFMIPRMRCYAMHWSYLVRAYYILLQNNISPNQIREAHRLLTIFVGLTEFYYSRSAMTFNIHQLLHTAQCVINWGPLFYHSGYGFENGNGNIVKLVQAAKGVQYQIVRIIGMNRSDRIITKFILQNHPDSEVMDYVRYLETRECGKVLTTNIGRYFGKFSRLQPRWRRELNLSDAAIVYRKLVKMKCVYLSCNTIRLRSNNSFAKIINGNFVQIVFFIIDRLQQREYTVCRAVDVENISDNILNGFQVKRITAIGEELTAVDTNNLDKICVYMNCNNERYLCAIPNCYSY